VLLRLYAGLSEAETGEVLALPARTVRKQAEHGMREVAAAGESAPGARWRTVPTAGLAQELSARLRDALDQPRLPGWGQAGLADLAGRARRRRTAARASAMTVRRR